MAADITHECERPYGPGDNPYTHWARGMVAPRAAGDAPEPPRDGRRLRRRAGRGETWAVPLVVRLAGKPGSDERDAAREALRARVDRGDLLMDAHERARLRERIEDAGPASLAARRPELVAREVCCLYHPSDSDPMDPRWVVVEQGAPAIVARAGPGARAWAADPPAREDDGGDPPVIGVIDDGLAFLNARFRRTQTRTRFDAVWMQGFRTFEGFEGEGRWPLGGAPCPGFAARGATRAGAILEARDIDHLLARGEALDEAAVYVRLSRAVHDDPDNRHSLMRSFSHGTHVADLAAGADPLGDDEARRWPLLGVGLPPEAVSDTAGQDFQARAIAAVRWILHRARRLGRGPVVLNVSFGALAGPKDGSRAIEWVVADELALFEAFTGRVARVNWSFGNARLERQVARFEAGAAPGPIDWRLQPEDRAASFLEIRPDDGGRTGDLTVEVSLPGGRTVALPAPPPTRPVTVEVDGRPALRLYRAPVPAEGWGADAFEKAHLVLAAAPTAPAVGREPRAPAGAYAVALRWRGAPGAVMLEVQRGDTPVGHPVHGRQSYLDHPLAHAPEDETEADTGPSGSPVTRAGTHTANAHPGSPRVWTTGAARPGRSEDAPRPARYAAAGRHGSDARGPTISAIAERGVGLGGVLASGTLSGTVRASGGSSAAAPRASRALALVLAGRAGTGGEPDKVEEAREVVARGGFVTDRWRERHPPMDPHHLEPRDGAEPGDADRLGEGTVVGRPGRPGE